MAMRDARTSEASGNDAERRIYKVLLETISIAVEWYARSGGLGNISTAEERTNLLIGGWCDGVAGAGGHQGFDGFDGADAAAGSGGGAVEGGGGAGEVELTRQ